MKDQKQTIDVVINNVNEFTHLGVIEVINRLARIGERFMAARDAKTQFIQQAANVNADEHDEHR